MSVFNLEGLQKAAETNPYFKATMELFVNRQRRRSTLTAQAIKARLKEKGFKITYKDSESILRTLAANGVGVLREDMLISIGEPLDQIGKAVMRRNQVKAASMPAPVKKQQVAEVIASPTDRPYRVSIDVPADKLNAVLDQISKVLNKGG